MYERTRFHGGWQPEAFLWQVPRAGHREYRSGTDRPRHATGAGCSGRDPFELGDALRTRSGYPGRLLRGPPIGSQVWVEFEQGDPDYPIWTGGFWGLVADVPVFATAPPAIPPGQNIVLQTTGQNMILISDAPPTPVTGGIVLKSTTGAMI